MDTSFVISVGLTTSPATHEAPPIGRLVRLAAARSPRPKVVAAIAKEPRLVKRAPVAEAAQLVKTASVRSQYKLAISRSRLDAAVENCLLAVFGFMTAMLAVIVTTVL